MQDIISTDTVKEEVPLIRYAKPSHISEGEVTDEFFQLREDRSPPEEYISFYHSKKESEIDKIEDVKEIFEKKKFKIKKTGGFFILNSVEASTEINMTRKIISFNVCTYPHYGMSYLSKEQEDIVEARTLLIHYAELYMNS